MKILPTIRAFLIAGFVGLSPLSANAAPKKEDKKADEASKARAEAKSAAAARPASKPVSAPAPKRAPQKPQAVARNTTPKQPVKKSPAISQSRPQPSAQNRNHAASQQSSAQNAQVAKAQAQRAQIRQAQAAPAQAQRAQAERPQVKRAESPKPLQAQRPSVDRSQAQRDAVERAQAQRASSPKPQTAGAERPERVQRERSAVEGEERPQGQRGSRPERSRSSVADTAAQSPRKNSATQQLPTRGREANQKPNTTESSERERDQNPRERIDRPARPGREELATRPSEHAERNNAGAPSERRDRSSDSSNLTERSNELAAARLRATNRDAQRPAGERDDTDRVENRAERPGGRTDLLADRSKEGRADRENKRLETQRRIAEVRKERQTRQLNPVEIRERKQTRAERREKVRSERTREIAQLQERTRGRVERFRENRRERAAAVQARRSTLRSLIAANQRGQLREERVENRVTSIVETRHEVRDYWHDRGDVVRYHVADRRDHLFDDDWWEDCGWRRRPVYASNPWWWWHPAEWSTVNVFLDAGWSEPLVYDYGTDVIDDNAAVYVHGEPVGTPVEYSRRVIQLANPVNVVAEAPVVEADWTPLGVWALVQENQDDNAVMFFQLSVDQAGIISGGFTNVVSGEVLPVSGQVDRETQRAAWHVGKNKEKVFEAGMANLTENEASCLIHVAPGEMQPWLLVRMQSPDLPTQPAALSETTTPQPATAAAE